MLIYRLFLFIFIVCTSFQLTAAHTNVLRVGYIESPPFAWQEGGDLHGITQEIWQQIAMQLELRSQYVNLGISPKKALHALEQGEVDLLIAPLAVTYKRLQKVDFTRPYFINQVGVVLKKQPLKISFFLKRLFDHMLIKEILFSLGVFILFTHIYWLARRRSNPALSTSYLPGITNALWLAFANLVHKKELYTPKNWIDKTFMFAWLIFALIFISSVFGVVTSAITMTLSEVDQAKHVQKSDLENMTVGVLEGSQNAHVAKKYTHKIVRKKNYNELFNALQNGRIDAIIIELITAQEYLRNHPQTEATLTHLRLNAEEFGFALQKESPYLKNIDLQITKLQDTGQLESICRNYVGPLSHACRL